MGINYNQEVDAKFEANLVRQGNVKIGITRKTHFKVECFDEDGNLKWADEFYNLVVNAGLDDSLDKHLKGSSYTAAWYVGLTDGTPTFAAGDIMSSHAGWVEDQNYDEATREALVLGAVSGQSVNNSASKASFTMSATTTVGGAFITTGSAKGGTTGVLYGGGAFTGGDRSVVDNDIINVTATFTAAAS